jgi:hypothetical protein
MYDMRSLNIATARSLVWAARMRLRRGSVNGTCKGGTGGGRETLRTTESGKREKVWGSIQGDDVGLGSGYLRAPAKRG